jgi:hypothetical protein
MAVVAMVPIFKNQVSENPMMPSNHYDPVLFQAAIHFVLFVVAIGIIWRKVYSWFFAIPVIVLLMLLHFYYDEIAIWVWQNL